MLKNRCFLESLGTIEPETADEEPLSLPFNGYFWCVMRAFHLKSFFFKFYFFLSSGQFDQTSDKNINLNL